jgi:hypothetical protein
MVALGLNVLAPAPAMAVWTTCEDGKICMWSLTNGNGTNIWEVTHTGGSSCRNLTAGGSTNNAESVWNRTGYSVDLWTGANCAGSHYNIAIGSQTTGVKVSDLGSFNNTVESYRVWG